MLDEKNGKKLFAAAGRFLASYFMLMQNFLEGKHLAGNFLLMKHFLEAKNFGGKLSNQQQTPVFVRDQQCDLMNTTKMAQCNDGYHYILLSVDILSH